MRQLLFASDRSCGRHALARDFLDSCAASPKVLCLTWPTVMAYLRIGARTVYSNDRDLRKFELLDVGDPFA